MDMNSFTNISDYAGVFYDTIGCPLEVIQTTTDNSTHVLTDHNKTSCFSLPVTRDNTVLMVPLKMHIHRNNQVYMIGYNIRCTYQQGMLMHAVSSTNGWSEICILMSQEFIGEGFVECHYQCSLCKIGCDSIVVNWMSSIESLVTDNMGICEIYMQINTFQ